MSDVMSASHLLETTVRWAFALMVVAKRSSISRVWVRVSGFSFDRSSPLVLVSPSGYTAVHTQFAARSHQHETGKPFAAGRVVQRFCGRLVRSRRFGNGRHHKILDIALLRSQHQEKRHAVGIKRRGIVHNLRRPDAKPFGKLVYELAKLYIVELYHLRSGNGKRPTSRDPAKPGSR